MRSIQLSTILVRVAAGIACFVVVLSLHHYGTPNLVGLAVSPPRAINSTRLPLTAQIPIKLDQIPHYSSSNCAGPGDPAIQRCHFRNVCLRLLPSINPDHNPDLKKTSTEILFYQPEEFSTRSKEDIPPIYWNQGWRIDRPWARMDRETGAAVRPTVVYGKIPVDSWWSPAETGVLTGAWWPENYGHSLGDDFFPVYRLARAFNLWSRSSVAVIFHPHCGERGVQWEIEQGCSHHEQMSEMILDRQLMTSETTELWPQEEGPPLCFKNLLVGTNGLTMGSASESAWSDLIDEVRSHYFPTPLPAPTSQRITIFEKQGRRTVLNYEALISHLSTRFQVPVDLVNPAKLDIAQQLEVMSRSTVLVSPCGGVSFGAMLLPHGASAVFIDYWDTLYNASTQMERYIFTYASHFTPFFYAVEKEEITIDMSQVWVGVRNDEREVYRNYGNVTVDLNRMERYIESGLLAAEVALDLRDSFALV